ncbi:MAG: hypothetical protein WCK70_07595 [Chloroflexales bacterium]
MTTPSPRDTEQTTLRRPVIADSNITTVVGVAAPVLISLLALVLMLGSALVLAVVFPDVGTSLNTAMLGQKSFWYLTRASAFVSYGLLWWSMVLGLTITNRMARAWPGGPTVSDIHEYASILGLVFATIHALSLLGDQFFGFSLVQILLPFASADYEPFWVGLGQLAFYLMIPVAFSFYVRRWISWQVWRIIHYLSFGIFALALAHGIWSGSDSGSMWVRLFYAASGLSLVALTIYRIQVSRRLTGNAAA